MANAFYASKLSENISKTPEGFLICKNVPIARTGVQEYLGREIGRDDAPHDPFPLNRSEEEVFHPATIASFEGKPVCDGHPTEDVTPENIYRYQRGHVQNVHRGADDQEDLLIADLVITDPGLISDIENGKREVSCGYSYTLDDPEDNGNYEQKQIRGNHVAVVQKGRAGDRVKINDSAVKSVKEKAQNERSKQSMFKVPGLKEILGKGLKQVAADADPEMLVDTFENVQKELQPKAPDAAAPAPAPAAAAPAAPEGGDKLSGLEEAIKQLTAVVTQLVQSEKPAQVKPDALDALEAEIKNGEEESEGPDGEEAEIIEPDKANDEEGAVVPAEDRPKNPIPGADALPFIRRAKKYIAMLPEDQRKKAADEMAKDIRQMMRKPPAQATGSYASMLQPKKATDTKAEDADNGSNLGKELAAKFNPHYRKETK